MKRTTTTRRETETPSRASGGIGVNGSVGMGVQNGRFGLLASERNQTGRCGGWEQTLGPRGKYARTRTRRRSSSQEPVYFLSALVQNQSDGCLRRVLCSLVSKSIQMATPSVLSPSEATRTRTGKETDNGEIQSGQTPTLSKIDPNWSVTYPSYVHPMFILCSSYYPIILSSYHHNIYLYSDN